MRKEKAAIFKYVLKLLGITIWGTILAAMLACSLDIPSWFTDSYRRGTRVNATAADNSIREQAEAYSYKMRMAADFEISEEVSRIRNYKEELVIHIDMLKNEITVKEAEFANLDEKLKSLENTYDQLMQENERITEEINTLTQAAKK